MSSDIVQVYFRFRRTQYKHVAFYIPVRVGFEEAAAARKEFARSDSDNWRTLRDGQEEDEDGNWRLAVSRRDERWRSTSPGGTGLSYLPVLCRLCAFCGVVPTMVSDFSPFLAQRVLAPPGGGNPVNDGESLILTWCRRKAEVQGSEEEVQMAHTGMIGMAFLNGVWRMRMMRWEPSTPLGPSYLSRYWECPLGTGAGYGLRWGDCPIVWLDDDDDDMSCVPEKPQGDHCGGAGTGVPGGGGRL